MARSVVVAQATGPQGPNSPPPKVITVIKPDGNQAITIHLDGATKLDLSAIANENITLVHVGDRLIILFDNHAEVTIEPFYSDNGQPLPDITVDLGPGRDVTASQFASEFPITTDQSVLPASGGPNSVSSGADFVSFTIDTFTPSGTPLDLLGSESANGPTSGENNQIVPPHEVAPPTLNGATITAAVDEGGLITDSIGTTGNDHGFAFSATGVAGSLNALVNFGSGGPGATPFQFVSTTAASQWLASLGLTSHGSAIDTATIAGNTLTADAQDGHAVFSLTVNANGSWTFTLLGPVDAPAGGPGENTETIDLSGLLQAVNSDGLAVTLSHDFTVVVTEDLPVAIAGASSPTGTVAEGGLQDAAHGGTDPFGEGNGGGLTGIEEPTGSLDALVAFGAAGPNATTPFRFAVANDSTINLGLTSHGAAVDFATVTTSGLGETLTAYTDGSTAGTKVFTLTILDDGSWNFQLLAPLDDGPNQGENGTKIDFSSLVQAVDFNGSAVTLAPHELQVTIADDAPVAPTGLTPLTGVVSDAALGNPGGDTTTGGLTGQLDTLVHFGADGQSAAPFQFLSDASFALTNALTNLNIFSAGAIVDIAIVTTTATGTTLTAEDPFGDQVFSLTLNYNGSWNFQLLGPIDVAGGTSEKFDLSSLIQAVDFDGSLATLATGDLEITVTADAPKPTGATLAGTVNEGGLFNITDTADNGTDPYGTGNEPASATTFTGMIGDLDTLVTFGASGPAFVPFQFTVGNPADVVAGNPTSGAISLGITSHGMAVNFATVELVAGGEMLTAYTGGSASGTAVFTMTIDSNGLWSVTLLAPVDNSHNGPLAVDLSGLVQAVDTDGSSLTLPAGDIVVTITDDTPLLATPTPAGFAGTVNEGGLVDTAHGGTDPYGVGNEPTSATSSGGVSGELDTFVSGFGADGPNPTPFQFVANASTVLAGLHLNSHGVSVSDAEITTTPGSGTTLAAWTTGGPSGGGTEVFTLTLDDNGSWSVTLLAPIDRNGPQTFDLSSLIEAVDFDGSAVTLAAGSIDVTITDDTPMLTGSVVGSVDEGGLTPATDPFGTGNDAGPTTASNSLGILFGADGAAAVNAVSFADPVNAANNVSVTDTSHNTVTLKSHGVTVEFALINAQTLVAYTGATAPTAISDPSVVFSVVLSATAANGSYDFVLDKPLDQSLLAPGSLNLIFDFTAKDFDGSVITGSFTVTDADDAPVLVVGAADLTATVNEGGLLSPPDPNGTGNEPGSATSSGGLANTAGSLDTLVHFGADGPSGTHQFQFVSTAASMVGGLNLLSHNVAVDFATVSTTATSETLTAFTGSVAGGTEVFTLTINNDGSWTFQLFSSLDNNGGNTIDLSKLVQAVDFDGSTVTLATGDLTVAVTDDTPVLTAAAITGAVAEGGLTHFSNPYGDGNEPGAPAVASGQGAGGLHFGPSLASLVSFGADGPGTLNLLGGAGAVSFLNAQGLTSHDATVGSVSVSNLGGGEEELAAIDTNHNIMFELLLNVPGSGLGSWEFTLNEALDDGPNQHENGTTIDLSGLVQAVDFDGSAVTLSNDFKITVADDAPVLSTFTLSTAIDEGALESGNPAPVVQTFPAGELNNLVTFGADGAAATAFTPVDKTAGDAFLNSLHLTSNGVAVDHTVVTGASLVAEDTNNKVVFTLTVNGDGSFTYEQEAPIDGVPVNGTYALDISGFIEAIDFDGSTKTLAGDVHIEINNDRPVVADVHASGSEYTPDPPSLNTPGTQTSVLLSLTETDNAGAAVTFTLSSLPANGTLFLGDGHTLVVAGTAYAATGGTLDLVFQPNAFFAGTTSFQYTAEDANGATSPSAATATIDVSPIADPPVLTSLIEPVQTNLVPADGSTPGSSQTVALTGGGFAESWLAGNTIFAQAYDALGHPLAPPATDPATGTPQNLLVALSLGGFAIAWINNVNDVFVQAFSANGTAGTALQVDLPGTQGNTPIQLTALDNGGFALIYERVDGANEDVYTAVFDANGHAVSGEVLVNNPNPAETLAVETGEFATPQPHQLATLANGDYVISWSAQVSGQITEFVRVFNDQGHPVTPEMQVSTPPAGDTDGGFNGAPGGSLVTALANGDFAVAWERTLGDGSSNLMTKLYHAGDSYAGEPEVTVSTGDTAGGVTESAQQIVALSGGGYAVMWTQIGNGQADTFVQVYDANGHLADPSLADSNGIQVDSVVGTGGNLSDQILALADGRFAVMWQGGAEGDAFVRVFNADGTPVNGGTLVSQAPGSATVQNGGIQMVEFADGTFAAVYDQTVTAGSGATQTTQNTLFVQQFDADGNQVGTPLELVASPFQGTSLPELSSFDDFRLALTSEGLLVTGGTTNDDVNGNSSFAVSLGMVETAVGVENQPIALFKASIPPDTFETLTVTITGVPAGGSFEINGATVGAAGAAGTWVIGPAQTGLLATSPLQFVSSTAGTFTLQVDAQSTDTATTGTSTKDTFGTFSVTIADANDVTLSNPSSFSLVSGGGAQALGIAAPVDADNGNDLTITVTAVPLYGTVQYTDVSGTHLVTDGTVLTSAELAALTYTPPASGSFTGDNVVYSVQDGPDSVLGSIAITVSPAGGGLYFSADGSSSALNPDLFTLAAGSDTPTSIPVNPPNGSSAGENGGFIQFANGLYFFADTSTTLDGLFRLGADNVAHAVTDASGHQISNPGQINAEFTIFDGSLYFIAEGSVGTDLFKIDPTGAVTEINVNPGGNAFDQFNSFGLTEFDGKLFFDAYSSTSTNSDKTALFEIDPNSNVATEVKDSGHSLDNAGEDGGFFTFNGGLFFNAFDPTFGDSLFVLDANGQPTLVMSGGSPIPHVTGETTYFQTLGANLYVTEQTSGSNDGLFQVTPGGTFTEIKYNGTDSLDFSTAVGDGGLGGIANFNGNLYFSAETPTTDAAIFADGGFAPNPVLFELNSSGIATPVTDAGHDILFAGEDGGFAAFDGSLYFFGDDHSGAAALFQINGGGTVSEVSDPTDAGPSFGLPLSNANFTQFDGSLYFEAETGKGFELVQIDSTGTAHVIDINPTVGPPTGSSFPGEDGGFGVYTPIATVFGTDGNDTLSGGANTVFIGGKGNDTITGAGTNDTAVIDANLSAATVSISGSSVTVQTANGTDTLTGIDRIQFADKGLLIVDPHGDFGYSSVQAAVNAATEGDTIWVMPGTYTETFTPTQFSSTPGGLFINTPNLTLQGVTADGTPITTASDVNDAMPTIISGAQTDFGSNFFVGPNGDNTVIEGLHLQAGPQTDNKLLEIWATNVTVQNDYLDVDVGGTPAGYSGAIAMYFNGNGPDFTREIGSFTVDNNILNEGIDISNGVGLPGSVNPNEIISDNTFEGTFTLSTGLGRYDTIVLNGQVPGIGWLLASNDVPTITGNHFGDNTTPFLMRGSDISAANLPTLGEVQTFLATNGNADTTYAYVENGVTHDLELAARNLGSGPFFSFAVTNTIDTLELALESPGSNNVFSGQETYLQPGDTVFIQSGPNALSSAIDVNNLSIEPDADSANLTLTMATTLADGEATPQAVTQLTLLDYAAGHGANVTVIGNNLGDTVTTNDGSDTLTGGTGIDTAVYTQALTTSDFTYSAGAWHVAKAGGASDTITGFEKVSDNAGHNFFLVGGGSQYTTIQEAVNAAPDGATILVAPGTYTENVVVNGKALSFEGFGGADGAGGAVLDGSISQTGTLDHNMTIEGFTINAAGSQDGVSVTPTLSGPETLTLNNDSITGASETGFAVNGGGTNLTVDTTNSSFSGNGIAKTFGGSGDIDYFEFLGNAAFTNVQVTGVAQGTPLANAGDNGIQIAGFDEATKDVTNPLGNVSFDNVDVTGTYAKNLVYIQGYDSASGLTFPGSGLTLGNATTQTGWTAMFVDLSPQGGTYTPSATPSALDLANVDLAGWSFVPGDAVFAELNALGAQTVIVGTAGVSNVITGTSGNDAIIYNQAEGGTETVNGGPGTDTEIINGTNAVETFNINPIAGSPTELGIDIAAGANNAVTATTGNSAVTTTNVEEIVLNLGNGGDTVLINGDLHGTGVATSTVTINGGTGNDTVNASGMTDNTSGAPVDVVFNGGGGDDSFTAPGALTTGSFTYDAVHNDWVVTTASQGKDTLHDVSSVTDGNGDHFLLVSPGSQYTTIQDAVDAAQAGDTILIAPGTYTETSQYVPGNFQGLYINTADLTLQGYSSHDGTAITTAAAAELYGPTVIAGAQNDFGANDWIDQGGSGTTIEGLHLQAGAETDNKLIEITTDNVTIKNDFIDTFYQGTDTGAAAIYLDNQGTAINSYLIDHNILTEGVYVASGVGTAGTISPTQIISNNEFTGTIDDTRFDMVAVQGLIPGIGWQLASAQTPTITGNTLDDNSAPFIFRYTEQNPALFPSASDVATIVAANTTANTTYAYVLNPDGSLHLVDRDISGFPHYNALYVANSINTLDEGLTAPYGVFGAPRDTMDSGDTVIVQGTSTSVEEIIVSGLTVDPTVNSNGMTFDLGSGTATSLALGDYSAGHGASVTVDANSLGDTITTNDGSDTLTGGTGVDTAAYTQALTASDFTFSSGAWHVAKAGGASDTITGFEKVSDNSSHNFLLVGGGSQYTTIQAAVAAAQNGDTILIAPGSYTGNVAINSMGLTLEGVGGVTLHGDITETGTLNGTLTIAGIAIDATGLQDGVLVSASSLAFAGAVVLDNVSIANAEQNGFAYIEQGNGSSPTHTDTIGSVSILNSSFSDNATLNSGANGRGDILLFGYNGNLTVDNVNISDPGADAQKAIQMRGVQDAGDVAGVGPYHAAGDVSLTDLTVTGSYSQDLLAFYNIAHFSAFTASGVSLDASAPWGLMNFDGVGGTVDLSSGYTTLTNLSPGAPIGSLQGLASTDHLIGTFGDDVLVSRGGDDTLAGGPGNDIYYVQPGDTVIEQPNQGIDEIRTTTTYTLPANVENLTLLDTTPGPSNTQTFENMAVGPITNGENGWEVLGGGRDQSIVDLGGTHGHVFKMSSDPSVADFAGPYSPALSVAAGEPDTGAAYNSQLIDFQFKTVSDTPDGSRLEVDFGNAAGTDRNNFLVIESFPSTGIRIAVSEPDQSGNFDGNSVTGAAPTDWVQLASGVDPTQWHDLQMRLTYNDGPNNDVIQVYLDGQLIGTTTTFENYHDALGGTHIDNATAYETDRVFFRPSADGAPQDGAGGAVDQGFYFDNLTTSVYNDINGTGNSLDNVITGNNGDNILTGGGGNDTINAGAGDDTIIYNVADGGRETVDGGAGVDLQVVNNNTANAETFNINPIDATHLGINIVAGANEIVPAAAGTYTISDTNVEALALHLGSGGDTVILSGDIASTGLTNPTLTIDGTAGGAVTVDGSAMTGTVPNLLIDLTNANFTSADHITGGSGNNTIQVVDATDFTVADAAFSHVSGIETLEIGGSGTDSVTLGANASANVGGAGHLFTLDASAGIGDLTLDASGMTADLKVLAGGGADTLTGGTGNDTFLAGIGNDIFTGGGGNNTYVFNSLHIGNDQITDFNNTTQSDKIQVSAVGFGGGLTAGTDATGVFETSGDANFQNSANRFHFDTGNNGLYYSADGTTGHEVLLATVTNATIHANDIHVGA